MRKFESRDKGFSRNLRWIAAGFLVGCAAASGAEPFKRGDWMADFEQLKGALTTRYPNFEWAAQRGLDLAAQERRARDRLEAATDDAAARSALERFLAAFGDGHAELRWPVNAAPSGSSTSPQPICTRLGFVTRPDTQAIARGLPGYAQVSNGGANVSAGVFESSGKKVGVLRIAQFSADASLCERALQELGVARLPSCEGPCLDKVEHRADGLLVESLEAAVRALVAEKVNVVLVDVAGNGGGNDSAITVARMLTSALLAAPVLKFPRIEKWAKELREDSAELRAALVKADAPQKRFLSPLIAMLEAATIEAGTPCDLMPLWQGRPVTCSNLVNGSFFAGGYLAEELPEEFRGQSWVEQVSTTARYRYTRSLWTGPLIVLVDGNSASATELMTAMLQDAGRARVVGAPTFGSGCGWMLGHEAIVLERSRGELFLPDCARFRRDGTNELDGIQPDYLIGFRRYDSPRQRLQRLRAALPEVLRHVP